MEELKEIRKSLGYTQEQVARILDISRRSYQYYEEGLNRNTLITKAKYEEILNELRKLLPIQGGYLIYPFNKIKEISTGVFKKHPEVKCAYLFGSYARREAKENSDIDIMIVAPELKGFAIGGLLNELMQAFKKEIDLVLYESLLNNETLLRFVLTDGIKIYG